MTQDLVKLDAATAALCAAADDVEEEFGRASLRMAAGLLRNAVVAGGATINAARANDLTFLFGDVAAAAADLTGTDAAAIGPLVAAIETEISALQNATALPPDLLEQIKTLRTKLSVRREAIQRRTFVDGGDAPLPHAPAELAADAASLRSRLEAAGFATPALDDLIARPEELTFRSIGDLVDELEVIEGV